MTYTELRCIANCSFCSQARESSSDQEQLSRVLWPVYPITEVLNAFKSIEKPLDRICIQIINYPRFIKDVEYFVKRLRQATSAPISIDTCPLKEEQYAHLHESGVQMIGIPLDAATPEIFDKVKGRNVAGPYKWEEHLDNIEKAKKIFGPNNVMTNLIIGLGETEEEAIRFIQDMMNKRVKVALFAFTPIPNTPLKHLTQPDFNSYRRIQLARYLITKGDATIEDMEFSNQGALKQLNIDKPLKDLIADGEAFKTSGCPGCNRPFYNDRPSGPLYNYPRNLTPEELKKEYENLRRIING
ncbi:radical SAM protein [Candidatus Bathyarchaeota archaeon]|nr:radical SAM protein [Candidatus Bathyarchaeota archaeon]